MSLEIFIAKRAEQDMTLQYRWYLENADFVVAERYLLAVHETIQSIAGQPDIGIRRHFAAPELASSAASRSKDHLTAICFSIGMAAPYALSVSCMVPEICLVGCWKSEKFDRVSFSP